MFFSPFDYNVYHYKCNAKFCNKNNAFPKEQIEIHNKVAEIASMASNRIAFANVFRFEKKRKVRGSTSGRDKDRIM